MEMALIEECLREGGEGGGERVEGGGERQGPAGMPAVPVEMSLAEVEEMVRGIGAYQVLK